MSALSTYNVYMFEIQGIYYEYRESAKRTFLVLSVICWRLKIYLFMLKINQFFPLIEKSLHNQSEGSRDTHHQILPQQIPSDN